MKPYGTRAQKDTPYSLSEFHTDFLFLCSSFLLVLAQEKSPII